LAITEAISSAVACGASTSNLARIASKPAGTLLSTPRVPRRSRSPSTLTAMRSVFSPAELATIWQVSCAHAASAPSSMSPEHAAVPGPPTPMWACASWIARPMSTEQATGASVSLASARSVIRAVSAVSR
jgi:hypothetical protein